MERKTSALILAQDGERALALKRSVEPKMNAVHDGKSRRKQTGIPEPTAGRVNCADHAGRMELYSGLLGMRTTAAHDIDRMRTVDVRAEPGDAVDSREIVGVVHVSNVNKAGANGEEESREKE